MTRQKTNPRGSSHEDFIRADEIRTSSDRSFGLIVGGILLAIAAFRWLFGDGSLAITATLAIVGALLATAGLLVPSWLAPLNRLWTGLGLLLHRITNPLIMGLLFFVTLTPIALLMRLTGKDPLRLRFDRDAQSYWIVRDPPGPAPESMKQQF